PCRRVPSTARRPGRPPRSPGRAPWRGSGRVPPVLRSQTTTIVAGAGFLPPLPPPRRRPSCPARRRPPSTGTRCRGGHTWRVERFLVCPNGPLSGTVRAGGAKNSVLKLMAACLLAEGRHVLTNVPRITDVDIMSEVLG